MARSKFEKRLGLTLTQGRMKMRIRAAVFHVVGFNNTSKRTRMRMARRGGFLSSCAQYVQKCLLSVRMCARARARAQPQRARGEARWLLSAAGTHARAPRFEPHAR